MPRHSRRRLVSRVRSASEALEADTACSSRSLPLRVPVTCAKKQHIEFRNGTACVHDSLRSIGPYFACIGAVEERLTSGAFLVLAVVHGWQNAQLPRRVWTILTVFFEFPSPYFFLALERPRKLQRQSMPFLQ